MYPLNGHCRSTVLGSLPVLVSNEGASQLDVVAGVTLEFAHRRPALFDHVQEHLGELGVLVQVHQVGKAIVHFECHAHFLKRQLKTLLFPFRSPY